MNILEIPVISSRKNDKEKLFTLLSDRAIRKFEGLDVGYLQLPPDYGIYFYFLNQENEEYYYLWDLIIPHAIGCIIICDLSNPEIFDKNVKVIQYLEQRYQTPLHICALPVHGLEPSILKARGFNETHGREFQYFNPKDKTTAKKILIRIIQPGG
jgi:hypothetical protein